MDLSKLRLPFFPDELEWKPQTVGESNGRYWVRALAYVTNRAIMDRLDDVVGPGSWKNQYEKGPEGGVICGLSIKVCDEWVTKWDGSENTDIEAIKGGLSGAMKRAGVQWGIGRYLYDLEENFGIVSDGGIYSAKTKDGKWIKWSPPKLPSWAVPGAKQIKERGETPPAGDPPPTVIVQQVTPPVVETKLAVLRSWLNTSKERFTSEQSAAIRTDLNAAGTTDALLDALKVTAEGFILANDKASQDAFKAGGFEVV